MPPSPKLTITDIIDRLPRHPNRPTYRTRPLGAIRQIVVHYDGLDVPPSSHAALAYDPLARYISQANHHISKNWNQDAGPRVRGFGLMYHYRVSADGRIWQTQPEDLVLWHARHANYTGLSICCDLGPDQQPPTLQLRGLRALLNYLSFRRPDLPATQQDVWGHGELTATGNHTPCPGALIDWLQTYRQQ